MNTIIAHPPAKIQFHQRNAPVQEIQVYASAAGSRVVLVKLPAQDGVNGYFFVSYCHIHEIAWAPGDFGICPMCNERAAQQPQGGQP